MYILSEQEPFANKSGEYVKWMTSQGLLWSEVSCTVEVVVDNYCSRCSWSHCCQSPKCLLHFQLYAKFPRLIGKSACGNSAAKWYYSTSCTFHDIFKVKCLESGVKTENVNVATFHVIHTWGLTIKSDAFMIHMRMLQWITAI